MVINNRPLGIPVRPIGQLKGNNPKQNTQNIGSNFGDLLREKIQNQTEIKFSKHAELRLQTRNIDLKPSQLERIKNGVNKAEEKGVKDSLILVDDVALVVNIKNKTVVTAADTNELKENVFTNIDGAVIV